GRCVSGAIDLDWSCWSRSCRAGDTKISSRPEPRQSGLAPENLTTLPHLSVSSTTSLPKSAGEPPINEAPSSANLDFVLGLARIVLISLFSLSMISAGVPFGAPTPYQALAS